MLRFFVTSEPAIGYEGSCSPAGRAFSAGEDLTAAAELPEGGLVSEVELFHDITRAALETRVPLVAAVNGIAVGGACEMTLCFDARIGTPAAEYFFPENTLGLTISNAASALLPQLVGHKAMRLVMESARINAQDALSFGLLDEIVEETDLVETAIRMVHRWTRPGAAMRAQMADHPASRSGGSESITCGDPGPSRAGRHGKAGRRRCPPAHRTRRHPAASCWPAPAGELPPRCQVVPVVRCDDRGVVVTRPRWMWRDCCRVLTVAGRGGRRQARLNPARVRAMPPAGVAPSGVMSAMHRFGRRARLRCAGQRRMEPAGGQDQTGFLQMRVSGLWTEPQPGAAQGAVPGYCGLPDPVTGQPHTALTAFRRRQLLARHDRDAAGPPDLARPGSAFWRRRARVAARAAAEQDAVAAHEAAQARAAEAERAAEGRAGQAESRASSAGQDAARAREAAQAARVELDRARQAADRQVTQVREDAARDQDGLRAGFEAQIAAAEDARAALQARAEHAEAELQRARAEGDKAARQAAPGQPAGATRARRRSPGT